MVDKIKEFFASSWAINNKVSVYILTAIITMAGISAYNNLPKEKFPDIVVPTIFVNTVYPGTSPENMENLVTKPLEKQIKAISGVKKITSNSLQDFSNIIVEFNTDIDVTIAKQKVTDAVDKARNDLPKDLPRDPSIAEMNFSDMPIMNINIAGDYDLSQLKVFAERIKDRVETMKQITRVDMIGAPEREIQVNVDMLKLQSYNLTLGDVERAIAFENNTITFGTMDVNGREATASMKAEFDQIQELKNVTVSSMGGAKVDLKDIAYVADTNKKQESYARMNGKSVITMNVVKRAGENLIESSDKIQEIVSDMTGEKSRLWFIRGNKDLKKYFSRNKVLPDDLEVVITGDMSNETRITLHDLINTIIIGFVLVTLVLMFFMGVGNALFVGLSVPLSMCLAFLVMPAIGFELNMIVLFAFLLALGIVVDDAIVVVENTHRIFDNGKVPIVTAAKKAAGEVFLPVLSGTLTTLAPFIPLAFWSGIIGKFMFFLPITLIITLTASLLVAYIINPVFAVDFMQPHGKKHKVWTRGTIITTGVMVFFALMFYAGGSLGRGNLLMVILAFYLLNKLFLTSVIERFQNRTWPGVQNAYSRFLKRFLRFPGWTMIGIVVLFVFSVVFMMIRGPQVVFFPKAEPNFVYTYINLPAGTSASYTDSITGVVEKRIMKVIGKDNPIVKSVISNVTIGVNDPSEPPTGPTPNKGKIAVAFVEFAKRNGESTSEYLKKIQEAVKGVTGAEVWAEQERAGPPTAKPISIEVSGENLDSLISISERLKTFLSRKKIDGVQELKSDFENGKPEIIFDVDRKRASAEGISTVQIGMELRNALFGKEVSKFRDENDEYPIQVRYQDAQRNNIEMLRNTNITYRDMNMGGLIRSVPVAAFANIVRSTMFGGIKRKNQKRVITISSDVMAEYNPNEVVARVEGFVNEFRNTLPEGVQITMGGEKEEQAETAGFLGGAMMASLLLILLILVIQFNSIGKSLLILSEIIFSVIGVLLGVAIFKMDMSIVMTGVGIVALAGIVVRNGILLVEFTDVLRDRGYKTYDAIVEAGRTRMTPVLLTATATILGLIPLAVGLNIDFEKLFSEGNPHIYFGGDSVAFWGPLSWTMIFGLSFATFLTLILVPVMYLLMVRMKKHSEAVMEHLHMPKTLKFLFYIPLFLFIFKTGIRLFSTNSPRWKEIEY